MAVCPVCNETTSEVNINQHLDKGCPKPQMKPQWSFLNGHSASTTAKPSADSSLPNATSRSNQSGAAKPANGDLPVQPPPPSAISPADHNKLVTEPANRTEPAKPAAEPPAKRMKMAPLAEQMRPQSLDEYVGQPHLMGPNGIFTQMLNTSPVVLPSLVLWGPSGVGKTSLARVLARKSGAKFVELSAPSAGAADVKKVMADARKDWQLLHRRTILFLDEIHRFNRSQQDSLLSGVERGDVTLIGATTENPSFKLSGALLSRMRVFVLQPLSHAELQTIVERAITAQSSANESTKMDPRLCELVVSAASATGDARQALNMLETVRHLPPGADPKLVLQHSLVYDQRGDFHYDLISAMHKSVRGSDPNAALYYLARMLVGGEDPLYISRRLMRIASEDVGVADDSCVPFTVAVHTSVQQIGMPECDVMLAHAVVKLARAPKSVEVYKALKAVSSDIRSDPQISGAPVPLHLRNAPTKLMEQAGYGHNYKYNPNYRGSVKQEYLPPTVPGGWLQRFKAYLDDDESTPGVEDEK